MGYVRDKVYKLVWPEDHESHGLEVRVRSLTMGEVLDLRRPDSSLTEDAAVAMLASHIVDWNLEDRDTGAPVPTTLAGILEQDEDLVMEIIDAWTTAAAGVSPPLGPSSTGGEPSLEASLPMEPLSASQAS